MSQIFPSRTRHGLRVHCIVAALCLASSATLLAQNSPVQGAPAQTQGPGNTAEKATPQRTNAEVEKVVNEAMAAAKQANDTSRHAAESARSAKRLAWSGLVLTVLLVLGAASVVIWQRWQSGALPMSLPSSFPLSLTLPFRRPDSRSGKKPSKKRRTIATPVTQPLDTSRDRGAQAAADRLREFESKLASLAQRTEQIENSRLALERKVTALQDAATRERPVEAPASPLASKTSGAQRLASVGAPASRGSGSGSGSGSNSPRTGGTARAEVEVIPGTIQDDTVCSSPSSSRPMVEIRWRSGSSTAEVSVSPEYKFTAITGDYLGSFFDMDGSGEGVYETIRPAVVQWSAKANTGTLKTRGRVRAMGV